MELFLVRHGIAADAAPGGSDAERPLTDEGRRRTARAAAGLAALGCRPGVILTSPLRRARQTADILAEALPGDAPVVETPALAGGAPGDVLGEVRAAGAESVVAVGHMPDLADLASVALCRRDVVRLTFRKAGAMRLVFDGPPAPGRAWLDWLLPPRALRALAKSGA